MSPRPVYLVSIPYRNARPHWCLWFPLDPNHPKDVGKKIHVVGAPQSGFAKEVEHRFDWRTTRSGPSIGLFFLGWTDSSNIIDAPEYTKTKELNKNDKFEKIAMTINAPPAASKDVMPTGAPSKVLDALRFDIPGMRRCQEWTVEYINALVKAGLLPQDALAQIPEAKKLNPK